jgi:Zn ribbon nucleic-acid-binding protein
VSTEHEVCASVLQLRDLLKKMLLDMPSVHVRQCYACGYIAWHADNRTPYVLCSKCGSQDTRRRDNLAPDIAAQIFQARAR